MSQRTVFPRSCGASTTSWPLANARHVSISSRVARALLGLVLSLPLVPCGVVAQLPEPEAVKAWSASWLEAPSGSAREQALEDSIATYVDSAFGEAFRSAVSRWLNTPEGSAAEAEIEEEITAIVGPAGWSTTDAIELGRVLVSFDPAPELAACTTGAFPIPPDVALRHEIGDATPHEFGREQVEIAFLPPSETGDHVDAGRPPHSTVRYGTGRMIRSGSSTDSRRQ